MICHSSKACFMLWKVDLIWKCSDLCVWIWKYPIFHFEFFVSEWIHYLIRLWRIAWKTWIGQPLERLITRLECEFYSFLLQFFIAKILQSDHTFNLIKTFAIILLQIKKMNFFSVLIVRLRLLPSIVYIHLLRRLLNHSQSK